MRVTLCVNGTFRYPDYVRLFAEVGALHRFHFAHRRSRTAAALGLTGDQCHNVWPKHYGHGAAFRGVPGRLGDAIGHRLCDLWQEAVLRRWTTPDTLQAVVGGLAGRVIARAVQEGVPVLGHAITSHPAVFAAKVEAARADLGLPPRQPDPAVAARWAAELAGCDALLVDSHAVARSFAAHGVAPECIAVVRPGIDVSRFRPRAPDAVDRSRFLVVTVGLVTPRKAQHVLLRAWRRLALPGAELLLVGSLGRDGRAVLARCPDGVTHVGHVAQEALPALLSRASCFVLPSVEDGFGQAALEAMACGVPVILSDAVGAAELVRPGETGLVVPALDAEALAAALERLYREPALRAAMGQAAAAAAAGFAGWRPHVAAVLALHERLIARAPLTPAAVAA